MLFNLQRYSTHDGPGIRTVVFLKGCSLGCRWCQNPESRSRSREVLYDARLCLEGCQLCELCVPHAIQRVNSGITIDRHAIADCDLDRLETCCPTGALSVCGSALDLDEVMGTVLRDLPFYQRTGGGITLSGGEPFMQPEACAELLKRSHHHQIHTAVESCLHVPWHNIEPSLEFLDLLLADLKHVNANTFKQWTDGSAKRVMDNFCRLAAHGVNMTIRVPLIPDFNADEMSIRAITDFAADDLGAREIHFLPYHTLGINKYRLLDMPYLAADKPLDNPELLDFAQQYARGKGLTALLRG